LTPAVINAARKGAPVRLVAGREIAATSCGNVGTLYANAQRFPGGSFSLRQLKGKRVSIESIGTVSEFFLDTLLSTVGMTASDVETVVLKTEQGAAALMQGRIDALLSSHLERSLDTVSGAVIKGMSVADVLPGFQYSFVLFGARLGRQDRETGIRFLTAYLKGAKAFLEGKTPQFLFQIARATRLDPEKVARDCRSTFESSGGIDQRSIDLFLDWLVRKGYIEDSIQTNDFVDHSLIREAQFRLGG
jgi:NitT/TauT family transport system substrate-binding protein